MKNPLDNKISGFFNIIGSCQNTQNKIRTIFDFWQIALFVLYLHRTKA